MVLNLKAALESRIILNVKKKLLGTISPATMN